jgi:hypothetical protein
MLAGSRQSPYQYENVLENRHLKASILSILQLQSTYLLTGLEAACVRVLPIRKRFQHQYSKSQVHIALTFPVKMMRETIESAPLLIAIRKLPTASWQEMNRGCLPNVRRSAGLAIPPVKIPMQ